MFSSAKSVSLILLTMSVAAGAAEYLPALDGLGRHATPAEVRAWDIDVRPDFVGLPPGSGSVERGEAIWLDRCSSRHGDFGDSNEEFAPIVLGNVTEDDIESGRVASLTDSASVRTTFMKVATLSTLWDYINRAMPWNAPKSLTADEVYAVLAYLLNLAYIVDYDFVLTDENMPEVQQRMPNRNGMTRDHGLWTVSGQPDVVGSDCVKDCEVGTAITSSLPAYAMNAHGNLKDQMRDYGPFPGIQTAPVPGPDSANTSQSTLDDRYQKLFYSNGCLGCHQMEQTLVGPALTDIRARYAGQDASAYLADKIRQGGQGIWGSAAMPPMPQLESAEVLAMADWLASKNSE